MPAVIDTPGIYCLTSDFETNLTWNPNHAISVQADDVVVDLNGHTIDNLAAGVGTQVRGISAYQRKNITVRNGTIRGFAYGVYLDDEAPHTASEGHVVEDIRAERIHYVGIIVEGYGSIARRNRIIATGGSTSYGPPAFGIHVEGGACRVIDNDVITLTPTEEESYTKGITVGGPYNIVLGNRISRADYGIHIAHRTSKYRDNVATGISYMKYLGGTDADNND
jgi:hypothetical protein